MNNGNMDRVIKLLLVENDQHIRVQFNDYLQDIDLPLEISLLNSGQQVIDILQQQTVDCILLSDNLTDFTPKHVLEAIQALKILVPPLIVLTEKSLTDLDPDIIKSGAVDFVGKAACNSTLLKRIILYSVMRQQYILSQQRYLTSQKLLLEQQRINEENQRIARLEAEKADAELASKAKSAFLSNMSHELRTPLNAILGFAQLLKFKSAQPLSVIQVDSVNEIIKAGDHLLSLINDVLDLSKIEAGKINVTIKPVCAANVVNECLKLTVNMVKKKQVTVAADCSDKWFVDADPLRFKQVLLNLVSNAIKYNKNKGRVDIRCSEQSNGYLRISVLDTGIGIDKSRFDQMFQPFERLSVNSSIEGTGIGLALTKRIIEEMKGTLGFESEQDKGSLFWIELPITGKRAVPQPTDDTRQLVYIDSDRRNSRANRLLLNRIEKLKLTAAGTIELANHMGQYQKVNLVLIDIDGMTLSMLKLIGQIKEAPHLMNAPVIVLGSHLDKNSITEGLTAGCDQVLTKPISPEKLLTIVDFSLNQYEHG